MSEEQKRLIEETVENLKHLDKSARWKETEHCKCD